MFRFEHAGDTTTYRFWAAKLLLGQLNAVTKIQAGTWALLEEKYTKAFPNLKTVIASSRLNCFDQEEWERYYIELVWRKQGRFVEVVFGF